MLRLPAVLAFACLAFICWGSYGPILHEGQAALANNRWRPFICVGVAYFLVAVLIPGVLIRRQVESGGWTLRGIVWSLIAGALGCLGSLGLIMSFNFGGSPFYVMPLVFGGAPVVNTLVTMFLTRQVRPSVMFVLGITMVALGAAGVLVFQPTRGGAAKSASVSDRAAIHAPSLATERLLAARPAAKTAGPPRIVAAAQLPGASETPENSESNSTSPEPPTAPPAASEPTPPESGTTAASPSSTGPPSQENASGPAGDSANVASRDPSESNAPRNPPGKEPNDAPVHAAPPSNHFLGAVLSVIATVLCWGSYGPTLHKGQARMGGSRLRPFICVGISYFFLAILIPLFILVSRGDYSGWTFLGCAWSTLAGALGAIGALGIILAFNSGGTPAFVMPIVFGGAPIVNTFTTWGWGLLRNQEFGPIRPEFLFCLALTIAGAVTVLLSAPRGKPHTDEGSGRKHGPAKQ